VLVVVVELVAWAGDGAGALAGARAMHHVAQVAAARAVVPVADGVPLVRAHRALRAHIVCCHAPDLRPIVAALGNVRVACRRVQCRYGNQGQGQ